MNLLVTVIIPVYNTEKYLEKCIASVAGQSYKELEIILVNDGSTDGSLKIIREWERKDSRIYVINQENAGVSKARNAAIEKAQGEYIMCVDSDDWLAGNAVEKLYRAVEREKADIAICGIKQVWEGHTRDCTVCTQYGCVDMAGIGTRLLIDSVAFSSCNKIYKRSCIGAIRYPHIRICEDAVFNRHVFAKAKKVAFLPQLLYFNRQRAGSATKQKITKGLIDEHIQAIEQMQAVSFPEGGDSWDMSPKIILFELTIAIMLRSDKKILEYLVSWPGFYKNYREVKFGTLAANFKKTAVYLLLRARRFGLCMKLAKWHQRG